MSKIKFVILLIFILCLGSYAVSAADDIKLYINGEPVSSDVAPVAVSGRTMVPARKVFEKLGAEVTWIGSRQQIIIRSVKARIVLNLGSSIAYVNSKSVTLDVEPMVIEGRTLIPVRFVSEELGYDVRWEPSSNSVHINAPSASQKTVPDVEAIAVSSLNNSTVVTVRVDSMVRPNISYASSPTRFIADFPNATLSVSGSRYEVGNKDVNEVRYAIHPEYTRVVIESPVSVTYNVSYTSDTMTITVTAADEESAGAGTVYVEDDYTPPAVTQPSEVSGDALVIIDAGHGGSDCGAIGYNSEGVAEVYESKANLAIALAAQKYLVGAGVSVIMTRSSDVALGSTEMEDLLARSKIANDSGATFFVSIHNNSFTSEAASGTEILYADSDSKVYEGVTSKMLAQNILAPLVEATGLTNRGVKDSPKMVVLRTTTMPSVLIETAFVSNPDDRKVLLNAAAVDNIGAAIAQGVIKSIESRNK